MKFSFVDDTPKPPRNSEDLQFPHPVQPTGEQKLCTNYCLDQFRRLLWLFQSSLPFFLMHYVLFLAGSSILNSYIYCEPDLDHDLFRIGDWDLFVLTELEDTFLEIIDTFTAFCKQNYITIQLISKNENYIALTETKIKTVNFKVEGIDAPVSFIWYSNVTSILDVLNGFDIDICKVGYNISKKKFIVTNKVRHAIKSRMATVTKSFSFQDTIPTHSEIIALSSTLHRVRKYASRGFKFLQYPWVKFEAHPGITMGLGYPTVAPSIAISSQLSRTVENQREFVFLTWLLRRALSPHPTVFLAGLTVLRHFLFNNPGNAAPRFTPSSHTVIIMASDSDIFEDATEEFDDYCGQHGIPCILLESQANLAMIHRTDYYRSFKVEGINRPVTFIYYNNTSGDAPEDFLDYFNITPARIGYNFFRHRFIFARDNKDAILNGRGFLEHHPACSHTSPTFFQVCNLRSTLHSMSSLAECGFTFHHVPAVVSITNTVDN